MGNWLAITVTTLCIGFGIAAFFKLNPSKFDTLVQKAKSTAASTASSTSSTTPAPKPTTTSVPTSSSTSLDDTAQPAAKPVQAKTLSVSPELEPLPAPVMHVDELDSPLSDSAPTAATPAVTADDLVQLAEERQLVQSELIETELRYAALLELLLKHYALPIREKSPSDFSEIFSNLEAIVNFHCQTFAPELHRHSSDRTLAPVMLRLVDFLKIYSRLVDNVFQPTLSSHSSLCPLCKAMSATLIDQF